MFESEHLARASEPGLHFVKDQQDFVFGAPASKFLHVFNGRKGGVPALVGLRDDGCNPLRPDAVIFQQRQGIFKFPVRIAEIAGEGNLVKIRIEVSNPLFERRNAADLLRSESASMKRAFIGDVAVFLLTAVFASVGARELHGALGCL